MAGIVDMARIRELLDRVKSLRIGIYGDFCLDAYWRLDPRESEVSVETGRRAKAVSNHYYSLGGAGNVAANLASLGPSDIRAVGVVGKDIYGRELVEQLRGKGVDTFRIVVQPEGFDTTTYCKMIERDAEVARFDFGIFNRKSEETLKRLMDGLRETMEICDVVIINQQVPGSMDGERFLEEMKKVLKDFPDKIVLLDTRHYGDCFDNICRKINECEAARLHGKQVLPSDVISLSEVREYASSLFRLSGKPVFICRGARGILVCDREGLHEVPGIQLLSRLDTVGAGDTALSALACSLAAGASPVEAAAIANFAATVTVQKLFQTGTASPEEILAVAGDADYVYHPELAEDMRQAVQVKGSEIEVVCGHEPLRAGPIRHVIFDHDGTISVLRQGWESVMEAMMIRAILGDCFEDADETLYHRVRSRVVEYIDKSAGMQTILQMEALVGLVREFGIVSAEDVLDKLEYKKIYDRSLKEMINVRMRKLQRGELDADDFTIKGAVPFLHRLSQENVIIYLASGTDREDVIGEAESLGYAHLFGDHIYGAVGDFEKYSKKKVIENILVTRRLSGPELAVFGDGPVEVRECRKQGGIAVGVASDEVRRHGLNREKRSRLIKAGAHFVVPDFSQGDALYETLWKSGRKG